MLKTELKNYLIKLSVSYLPEAEQKRFSKSIDKVLKLIFVSERVFNNFKRICENDYYQSIYAEKPDSFLIYLEIILKISAYSNYLTDIVVRNPEFLTRFLSSDELHKNFSFDVYREELKSKLQIFKSLDKKLDAIRRFKRMHILRIGLRDILRLCDIEQSMREYSDLTRAILESVFELSLKINKEKSKIELIPDYALISLGKFGGNELNYSSDVDLICVYDNPPEKDSSNVLEFYDKVVKDFIQICSDQKDGNSLYRIDFRLRPDGKYSPLARSISYYQIYYETYGRDWERQMLLKMNFCVGSKELFVRFYSMLQNFVYPRTFFEPPQSFVKKFREVQKEKFDDESLSKNLKHFSGGIRDVEFSVQVAQLLYGGKFQELRTPNTIEAIINLQKKGLIDHKPAKDLIDAYKFLRRIENFIQLMDDRQTHSIPEDEDKFQNLIKFLGFSSKSEFNKKLNQVRKIVQKHYRKYLELDNEEKEAINVNIRIKTPDKPDIENKIQSINDVIENNMRFHSVWDKETLIKNFEKNLIKHIENSAKPESFIQNFLKFLLQVKTSSQIHELLNNKSLLKLLFEILENSEPLTNKLITNPLIFDFFFSGRVFEKIRIQEYFSSFDVNEIERFLFSIMINRFNHNLKSEEVGELLSEFIDKLIEDISTKNQNSLKIDNKDFVIIGLGSYGTKEIHFKSDIDLLFIFKSDINSEKAEKFSRKVLGDIRDKFKLYDFFHSDSRLRPEGSISKLSWTIDELKKYINERMRIWEFQSYTKMRMISGNPQLFYVLETHIKERIKNLESNYIASEIKRNKDLIRKEKIQLETDEIDLKNSPGGTMDIQFLTQFFILTNPDEFFRTGLSTAQLLKLLSKKNPDKSFLFNLLFKNYQLLTSFILDRQVLSGKKSFVIKKDLHSNYLTKNFKIKKPKTIFEFLNEVLKENVETFRKMKLEFFL